MLARLHAEYRDRGFEVVAVNISPDYSLGQWERFWKSTRAGDVVWAQGGGTAISKYRLVALGTEVIVDRKGGLAFRSDGPSGYKALRKKIEELL